MKILLVSATKSEIALLFKRFKKVSAKNNLTAYLFGSHSIDVLITGAGMIATAFYLGKFLNRKYRYDLAINMGIAGSFRRNIPLGTVVNVVKDCFADFGAEDGERYLTANEIGLIHRSQFVVCGSKIKNEPLNSLPKANAITVNTAHGSLSSIKRTVKRFAPDIESMEGAAFFFACKQEKISCIQIRAVSNYVERRNKKKWKTEKAIRNLCAVVENILMEENA